MSINQAQHRHLDANLSASSALPAAGATVYTGWLDTRSGGLDIAVAGEQVHNQQGNAALEHAELLAVVDATTALVASKTLTVSVQESNDAGVTDTAAAAVSLGSQVITGITGNGSAKAELRWKFPSAVKRYVRVKVVAESGSGDVTGKNVTAYIAV